MNSSQMQVTSLKILCIARLLTLKKSVFTDIGKDWIIKNNIYFPQLQIHDGLDDYDHLGNYIQPPDINKYIFTKQTSVTIQLSKTNTCKYFSINFTFGDGILSACLAWKSYYIIFIRHGEIRRYIIDDIPLNMFKLFVYKLNVDNRNTIIDFLNKPDYQRFRLQTFIPVANNLVTNRKKRVKVEINITNI